MLSLGIVLSACGGGSNNSTSSTTGATVASSSTQSGLISTIAGAGIGGYGGDGANGTQAQFSWPNGIAFDSAGNLAIADSNNNRVRMIAKTDSINFNVTMTAGYAYTLAGLSSFGPGGDGGPSTAAAVDYPTGVTFDSAGNLLIADTINNRIRMIARANGTYFGQGMIAGNIYTIAGNLYKSGFAGDGSSGTAALLNAPLRTTLDSAGNLVISDTQNNRIRVVANTNGTFYSQNMIAGSIYTIAGTSSAGFSGDGAPAISAQLSRPAGIAFDREGNLVIADIGNNCIRVIAKTSGTFYAQPMIAGSIYTVAGNATASGFSGDGGPATAAQFDTPFDIAFDGAGNLFVSDASNNRIRAVAKASGTYFGIAMMAGNIYTVAGTSTAGLSGDSAAATSAQLNFPIGITFDSAGNLVICDSGNSRIRQVTP